jgi:hypothetical protein
MVDRKYFLFAATYPFIQRMTDFKEIAINRLCILIQILGGI